MYNAIAGSCAEDEANSGAVSYANPVATMTITNLGPTYGVVTSNPHNTNAVATIPANNANINSNAGHTIAIQLGFSVASGLQIATSTLKSIEQGSGTANILSHLSFVAANHIRHATDMQMWSNDPDPTNITVADPVFANGQTQDNTVDSLATIQQQLGNVGTIFAQIQETAIFVSGNSLHNPPSLTALDIIEFTHEVTDSNGGIHSVSRTIVLA